MASSFDPQDDRQHGHGIRRRQGGRTSIYGSIVYPSAMAVNGQGLANACPEFIPADGDPGSCANCGDYDGEHSETAMGQWAAAYMAEAGGGVPSGGIPGSDGSTGAY